MIIDYNGKDTIVCWVRDILLQIVLGGLKNKLGYGTKNVLTKILVSEIWIKPGFRSLVYDTDTD